MTDLRRALREKGHPAGFHKDVRSPSNEELKRVYAAYQKGDDLTQLAKDLGIKAKILVDWISIAELTLKEEEQIDDSDCPIKCKGIEQSHYDNMLWALDAAGLHLRTGKEPNACPNDSAYFLFCQAKDEPKAFMDKVNQMESKQADKQNPIIKREEKRSIREIDVMLSLLEEEE